MDTKRNNAVLMQKRLVFENVDEEGNYVKSEAREIEQVGFWIRVMGLSFVPCECCQRRLVKEMMKSKQWSIGNKDTEPPVELWRKFEIDDSSWRVLEKRKATKEDKQRLGDFGITTYG